MAEYFPDHSWYWNEHGCWAEMFMNHSVHVPRLDVTVLIITLFTEHVIHFC